MAGVKSHHETDRKLRPLRSFSYDVYSGYTNIALRRAMKPSPGHFVSSIQHTSMCRLLRSSLSWSRFVADERPLTLNVPMVKFESGPGPFSGITSDGETHRYLYILYMYVW